MGSVVRMMLGWSGEEVISKANELGIHLDTDNENSFYHFEAPEVNLDLINIQREIIKNHLGFTILDEEFGEYDHTFTVETPKGNRKLESMTLQAVGSIYDMDLDNVSFGIRLNGIFRPVLMDWDGTVFGEGRFLFSVTDEKMKLLEIIKSAISEKYPIFKDAEWKIQSEWI